MAQIGVDKGEYIFDASLKTITFTGVTVDTVDQIKLVNNVTDGIIIFNPIDPAKLGVLVGNVLTLAHDTTLMSDTDDLFICINFLDVELSTESTQVLNKDLLTSIDGKDFSTETTLELIRLLTVSLDGKDYSTESTQILNKDLLTLLEGKDFSTKELQQQIVNLGQQNVNLVSVNNEILQELKTQTDLLRSLND